MITGSSTAEQQNVARSADLVTYKGIINTVIAMKRTMTEKKEYISPVSEILEIGTMNVLALSKYDEQIDDEEQWGKENDRIGGDWENIWGEM